MRWLRGIVGPYGASGVDPIGPAEGAARVIRGGAWNFDPRSARVAARAWTVAGVGAHNLGLRLVRSKG